MLRFKRESKILASLNHLHELMREVTEMKSTATRFRGKSALGITGIVLADAKLATFAHFNAISRFHQYQESCRSILKRVGGRERT